MENEKGVNEVEEVLARMESYWAYMDRFKYSDLYAKRWSRVLKTVLSHAVNIVYLNRWLLRTYIEGNVPDAWTVVSMARELAETGFEQIKAHHRNPLREYCPDEVAKMKEFN